MRGIVQNPARETADGTRRIFHVLEPYAENTLVLCLNGRAYTQGWRVIGWLTVELDEAPGEGDMVSFFYQQV